MNDNKKPSLSTINRQADAECRFTESHHTCTGQREVMLWNFMVFQSSVKKRCVALPRTHLKDQRKVLKARHKMAPGQGYSFFLLIFYFWYPWAYKKMRSFYLIRGCCFSLHLGPINIKETYADIISKPKT